MNASSWLAEFGNGALDARLTAALAEVAQAVMLQGKPGAVTLKLSMSEKGGGVVVATAITTAPPKSKDEAFFYVGEGGEMTRRDPKQPALFNDQETTK